jgi:tetratricopeptide (TPR) repeat protein
MAFAALAAVAAVYVNALHGQFVWDDQLLVVDPGVAHRFDLAAHLGGAFWHQSATQKGDASYYRPLTTLSFAVDWLRSGGSPGAFHATNLVLHLAVCLLVFQLARRMGAGATAAALATVLFGVFPRCTESVAWVSGRTDLIAAMFALAAILLHGGPASMARRIVAAACLFLGLLGKEVAAAALAAIVAIEAAAVLRREKSPGRALLHLVPVLVASTGYITLRVHALADAPGQPIPSHANAPWMPFQALGRYVFMVLDPRPRLLIGTFGRIEPALIAVGITTLVALATLVVRAVRSPPAPLTAGLAAAALAGIALVLHLRRLPILYLAADRFLYLPLAALVPLLTGTAVRLGPAARRAALAVAVMAIAVYAPLTVHRNEDWNDAIRLWTVAVETASPGNPLPLHELGNALADAGRHEEAILAFRAALKDAIGDFRVTALGNLAGVLSDIGRLDEARAAMEELVALDPARPANHFNLGVVEMRRLQFDAARAAFRAAIERLPSYDEARRALASVDAYERASRAIPPEDPDEPTDLHVRRARFWTMLGVRAHAAPLWMAVVARPDATPVDLEQATAYLVNFGDPDGAERAIRRAKSAGVGPGKLEAFQAVLRDRLERGPRLRKSN